MVAVAGSSWLSLRMPRLAPVCMRWGGPSIVGLVREGPLWGNPRSTTVSMRRGSPAALRLAVAGDVKESAVMVAKALTPGGTPHAEGVWGVS